ncbi:hypothetical protein [Nocardia beijingensis]|uniref:Uncharacterized protein n=1 Tax=Nocardia beijingensis TaxID=95162 RepID=A0ABW7WA58_9NOCA
MAFAREFAARINDTGWCNPTSSAAIDPRRRTEPRPSTTASRLIGRYDPFRLNPALTLATRLAPEMTNNAISVADVLERSPKKDG